MINNNANRRNNGMNPMGMMGFPMTNGYPQGNAMLNAGMMNPMGGNASIRQRQGIQQKLRQQRNAMMGMQAAQSNMPGLGANMGLTRNQRRLLNTQMGLMQ